MTFNDFENEFHHDAALAEQVYAALAEHRVPSLRHVRVEASGETITVRGEVHSYYAKQLLLHGVLQLAGDRDIVLDVNVVTPTAFRDPFRLRRTAASGIALLALALLAGCHSGQDAERVAVHPVQGQVLFQGRPATGAYVVFHPKDGLATFPSPQGHVDAQGNFALSTYSAGDGAPAGDYAVTVVLERMLKKGEEFERGPNVLPPKLAKPQTTTVMARVNEGQNSVPIKIVR